jgi:hypothetical protein
MLSTGRYSKDRDERSDVWKQLISTLVLLWRSQIPLSYYSNTCEIQELKTAGAEEAFYEKSITLC